MPKINVYLSEELADAVKQANLPVSAICQRALEQAVRRVTAIHETMSGSADGGSDDMASQLQHFNRFTGRMRVVLAMAVEAARADNRPVGTEHLLSALVAEAAGLGQSYIGSEHLLLGLIAEPNGQAGRLLRGAGAEPRLARRTVTAAVAGWVAGHEARTPAEAADVVTALTDAVRAQLAPIADRLDRLEQRTGA